MEDGPSQEQANALSRLIGRALLVAMQGENRADLEDYLARELPLCIGEPADASERRALRGLVLHATLMIWNATPLPSAGFRPRPEKLPERNEPCACGSGSKFKKCCGAFGQAFPTIPPEEVWTALAAEIEAGPAERLLGTGGLPPGALAPLARRLSELGRGDRSLRLLRKALKSAPELDDRFLEALVLEVELDIRASGMRSTLKRAQQRIGGLSRTARGRVLEALAAALADEGDLEGAWALLEQVRHETPESLGISHLEVTLHLLGGDLRRAADRSQYWLARLRRRGVTEEAKEVVEFLERTARDPEAERGELAEEERLVAPPFMAQLAEVVAALGDRAVRAYGAEQGEDGRFGLVAPKGVVEVEAEWARVWRVQKPMMVSFEIDPPRELFSQHDRWLAFLRRRPDAFDSLSILDDLVLVVAPIAAEVDNRFDDSLLVPLLDRAIAIIRESVASRGSARFPWLFASNRPPLRLMAHAALRLDHREKPDEAAAFLEWMLEHNPDDNHGNRAWLVNHYLRSGKNDRALAMSRHHADDILVDTRYGEVLALWRLSRPDEAADAALAVVADRPRVARALLAARMEAPEPDAYGVEVGGEEEAWLYREEMRETWRATPGAMAFLAAVPASVGRKKAGRATAARRGRAR